jgi:hypothetical protein
MASSGVLRRVALVRTDLSEELIASVIRVIRIGELRKMLAATNSRRTLRRNTKWYFFAACVTDSCHPDEGGAKFFRNVGSYKSHTV